MALWRIFGGCFGRKRRPDTESMKEKFLAFPQPATRSPKESVIQFVEAKKHILCIEYDKKEKNGEVICDYDPELLMQEFKIGREDATSALRGARSLEKVREECQRMALRVEEKLRARSDEGLLGIPTWDTRHPPNVTRNTRVISILGINEDSADSTNASPALGDGWVISDFYLWLHLLRGMGVGQEWISCIQPKDLLSKYGRENKMAKQKVEICRKNENGDQVLHFETRPLQMKCEDGFLQGDEFEMRAVVLDDSRLGYAKRKVNIGPKGLKLRDHFLERLRHNLALAAAKGEHVLIMIFAQGSLEPRGGLAVGVEIEQNDMSNLLNSDQVASVLREFPGVDVSLYVTSCYSGHWITTPIFKIHEDGQWSSPDIFWLPDAQNWSPARRHAQAIMSKAALRKWLQMEPVLRDNASMDTVHLFHKTTSSIVADMYRLCLPGEVADYGSSPLFTEDDGDLTNSWRSETSYGLGRFEKNYNRLRKVEPMKTPLQLANLQPKLRNTKDEHPDWETWSAYKLFEGNYIQLSCGYGCTARGITSLANAKYLSEVYRSVAGQVENDNEIKSFLSNIFEKDKLTKSDIFRARREFIYRLNQHKSAQDYADSLNLYHLPGIDAWQSQEPSKSSKLTDAKDTKMADAFLPLLTSELTTPFAPPEFTVGLRETKHIKYLAASMAAAGYTEDEAKKGLEQIQANIDGWMFTDFLAWRYLGSRGFMNAVGDARMILRN